MTALFQRKNLAAIAGGILAIILVGCVSPATQRVAVDPDRLAEEAERQRLIALESMLFDQLRMHRVAFPLLEAASSFAGRRVRPYLGIYYANRYSFSLRFSETAASHYGLGEALSILEVVPDSPAEFAGLHVGDILHSVNGNRVPEGPEAPEAMRTFLRENLVTGELIPMIVVRGDRRLRMEIIPTGVADFSLILGSGQSVNAKATGKKVVVNRGMLRFAETDNELAIVISHEIAHNLMRHVRAVLTNYALGTALDIAAASMGIITVNAIGAAAAYSRAPAFEAEADYVGLYIMARAGLPIDQAAEFWRRIAAIDPGSIHRRILATHPSSPERAIALENTIEEITQKMSRGAELLPELRPRGR